MGGKLFNRVVNRATRVSRFWFPPLRFGVGYHQCYTYHG